MTLGVLVHFFVPHFLHNEVNVLRDLNKRCEVLRKGPFCAKQYLLAAVAAVICHGLNVGVTSQFISWDLIPDVTVLGGGDFGKWLSDEGSALTNGISALISETAESIFAPSIEPPFNNGAQGKNYGKGLDI